jgi:hypothetical protein
MRRCGDVADCGARTATDAAGRVPKQRLARDRGARAAPPRAIPVDAPIVRPNRDTLYSFSIFDLDAGPVTITLPNAGQRFMSLQVIDGDQYTPEVHYGAGRHTFTTGKVGTRYVQLGVRILVDPNDPEDMNKAHALQDAITVEQPGGPGRFEVPNWDQASQKKGVSLRPRRSTSRHV